MREHQAPATRSGADGTAVGQAAAVGGAGLARAACLRASRRKRALASLGGCSPPSIWPCRCMKLGSLKTRGGTRSDVHVPRSGAWAPASYLATQSPEYSLHSTRGTRQQRRLAHDQPRRWQHRMQAEARARTSAQGPSSGRPSGPPRAAGPPAAPRAAPARCPRSRRGRRVARCWRERAHPGRQEPRLWRATAPGLRPSPRRRAGRRTFPREAAPTSRSLPPLVKEL